MKESKMTYKEAMEEIESVVEKLEDNRLEIDELSAQVKRVSELLTFCKAKLHETEEEVEKVLKEMDE